MANVPNITRQDKVRELQVKLYLAAKRSPSRRFHALWDCIHRRDVLERAWQQVRENRGAAGVDRITIAQIEEAGGRGVSFRAPGRAPRENDGLHWPRRDGLKWPHLASVVVGVDVA